MRQAIRMLATLVCLAASPVPAQEIELFGATDLRDACHNLTLAARGVQAIPQDDAGAMLCLGYLSGWMQAMEFHLGELATREESAPYCWPEQSRASGGDLAALVVDHVDAEVERRSLSAHQAVLQALVEAFPCVPQPPEEP